MIINYCFAQASGLALYGVGENIGKTDVASMSLGKSTFFSANKYGITMCSPSSLWKSTLTRFTIHSGLNYLDIVSFPQQFQHNLTYFSLLFPIGDKKVFGFGLKPTLRTNTLEMEEDYQLIGSDVSTTIHPMVYKKNYYIDGGISEILLQYSSKRNTNLSLGIQYSFLFGNQLFEEKRDTYDIEIDSVSSGSSDLIEFIHDPDTFYVQGLSSETTYIQNSTQLSGSEFMIEGRYNNANHEIVLRTALRGNIKLQTSKSQNTDGEVYYNNINNKISASISEFSLGYLYKISDKSGAIIETQLNYPINIPEAVALFNVSPPYENSIHLGTYYQIPNPKFSYWNNLNIRSGGYLKQFDFSNSTYIDYGVTFGLGFEYLGNTQELNVSLCAGKRESFVIQGEDENYISLHFGITTGEKWFMKRKRK